MDFKKIKHSKCPNCGEYSLPVLKICTTYNPILECPYCKKKYRINRFVSFISLGAILVLIVLICKFLNSIINIPVWVCYIFFIIGFILFQYFAPLEEVLD